MENVISTSLCEAARLGLRSELRRLIDAGHHVYNADNRGYTPLHEAIVGGHEDCAELLLQEEDCNPNARTHEGYTPLYLACKHQNKTSLITLLANYGADVNLADCEDLTPLHVACSENKLELVRALLYHQADVTRKDFNGLTPLHTAVSSRHFRIMRELLDKGACPDEGDMFGRSALFLACEEGWEKGVRVLVEHGASVNCSTKDGLTPLMAACQRSFEDIVNLLLQHRANPNLVSDNHQLALSLAVHSGNARLVKILLEETSRDVILKNSALAPRHLVSLPCLAIDGCSLECLTLILDSGLGPTVCNAGIPVSVPHDDEFLYTCISPLGFLLKDHLLQPKAEEMMDLLLERGIPVNAAAGGGMMPPIVGLVLSECDTNDSTQYFMQIKFHFFRKLLKHGCDLDGSSLSAEYTGDLLIPDAIVAACLFSDLQQNEAMVRIIYESSVACNANHILEWLWSNYLNGFDSVLHILKDYVVPSYSSLVALQRIEACLVQSLQALSRFVARQWLWKTLRSSSKVKDLLHALRVPHPVQRYLIGCAWCEVMGCAWLKSLN
ncbi:ankyrin repeat and SOCS box protein 3 isoform X2 [Anabrus simplex]|uniref:ankyrin repeat and SOCS box protein 3 isoform X2 n=1 Tax=Anabrus simplex TaxID=316456 RepID=UPI0035A3C2CF